jgi:hypothetical protein
MTIHYPTGYSFGNARVSVDNRTATKVSVWYADEATPRQRFTGAGAYDEAMNFAQDLDFSLGGDGSSAGGMFIGGDDWFADDSDY